MRISRFLVKENPKPNLGVRFRICLAASCRLCTNFELSIKNFMGCSACFTLEIICDIINQNKPVEK